MITSLKRTIKWGWISFIRNIGLSVATIFIVLLVIFLTTFFFFFDKISKAVIADIQEKVDVTVYFKKDVSKNDVMAVRNDISQMSEVKDVVYLSEEEALENFIEKHKDDPMMMESLREVGDNPFLPSLNIVTWQASQYETVTKLIGQASYQNQIEKVDYFQRKPVIDKVFAVVGSINNGGFITGLVLIGIAILVVLNTIRIAIANSNEEIATMRLVGASNWFIRGPFIFQGIVVGMIATALAFLVTFGIALGFNNSLGVFLPGLSFYSLFLQNIWALIFYQILTGVGLGVLSSMIAIRRYLKV